MTEEYPAWLTDEVQAAMGQWPDRHVAESYDVPRRTVTRWRNRLAINSNRVRERGRRGVLVPALQAQVDHWRRRFRVLDGWSIKVKHDPMSDCEVTDINVTAKRATILTCQGLPTDACDANGVPIDYVPHELLHVALEAAEALGPNDGEEVLVQDICWMLVHGVGS